MIYELGSQSRSVDLQINDDTGNGVTGLVAATFPPMKYSLAGPNADVAFPTLSDLATITTAWVAGGVKERDNGWYRVDLPNGVFASAGVVTVRGDAAGKHVILDPLDISPPVNTTRLNGTAQTARDIGANVLLQPGTGTGQVDLSNGIVKADLTRVLTAALSETNAGNLAAAFKKLFDVAAPVLTAASVNQGGDSYSQLTNVTYGLSALLTAINAVGGADPQDIADAVFQTNVDGVAFSTITEMLLAFMSGKTAVTNNGTSTTVSFKARDGATEIFAVTFTNASGQRASSGSIS